VLSVTCRVLVRLRVHLVERVFEESQRSADQDRAHEVSSARDDPGGDTLALHRSSQRFRNTVNIEAQVRETALRERAVASSTPRPGASLASLDDDLLGQAGALAVAARQQSDYLTRDYRQAVQDLAESSDRTRAWVGAEVALSLLLTWLITRVFLGRHVVARLRRVSHTLRHGDVESAQTGLPVQGDDEIADMARAVEQFLDILADVQRIEYLHVRKAVEKDDPVDQFVGVLHFLDRFLAPFPGEILQAPIVEQPVVQPVLVDRSQFVAERLVQEIDDLGVALHDALLLPS